MFREMRRKTQALDIGQCEEILARGASGVLALLGDGGYPYAVPLSYVYDKGKLFFHAAKEGHKMDAVRACDKASFCVVDQDEVAPEIYTTRYRSAIAFGRIRLLEDDGERRAAIERLAIKYAPHDSESGRAEAILRSWQALCLMEMTIEHLTGKEAIELVRERRER